MKGKIVIDRELCKGCGYCIKACPEGLIAFNAGFNTKGYYPVEQVNVDKCNGCGLCAIVCPDIAIEVWREERKTQNLKLKAQNYGKKK